MPELKTRRSIKIWQPAGFEGLELNKVRTDQLYGPRHVHETYQIGLILRGGGTFGYRGARTRAPAGCLAVVQAGEAHSCHTDVAAGWSFGILYVSPELFEVLELTAAGQPHFSELVFDNAGLAKTMLDLFRSFERPTARLESLTGRSSLRNC